jgi:hypothetical protein
VSQEQRAQRRVAASQDERAFQAAVPARPAVAPDALLPVAAVQQAQPQAEAERDGSQPVAAAQPAVAVQQEQPQAVAEPGGSRPAAAAPPRVELRPTEVLRPAERLRVPAVLPAGGQAVSRPAFRRLYSCRPRDRPPGRAGLPSAR